MTYISISFGGSCWTINPEMRTYRYQVIIVHYKYNFSDMFSHLHKAETFLDLGEWHEGCGMNRFGDILAEKFYHFLHDTRALCKIVFQKTDQIDRME